MERCGSHRKAAAALSAVATQLTVVHVLQPVVRLLCASAGHHLHGHWLATTTTVTITQVLGPLCVASFLASSAAVFGTQIRELWAAPVWTQRGIPKVLKPDPGPDRCRTCQGEGKVTCAACLGAGRSPGVSAALLLKKGEFPKPCLECLGSTRVRCWRCLGSGQMPKPIGFRV